MRHVLFVQDFVHDIIGDDVHLSNNNNSIYLEPVEVTARRHVEQLCLSADGVWDVIREGVKAIYNGYTLQLYGLWFANVES